MEYVQHDWNMLKDKNELEIIGRYTYIGSLCTLCFTGKTYVTRTSNVQTYRAVCWRLLRNSSTRFHGHANLHPLAVCTNRPRHLRAVERLASTAIFVPGRILRRSAEILLRHLAAHRFYFRCRNHYSARHGNAVRDARATRLRNVPNRQVTKW